MLQKSIFLRLLVVCVGSLAVIWTAFGAYLVYDSARIGSDDVKRDLQLQASALARLATTTEDPTTARAIAESIRALNVDAAVPAMRADEFTYQLWDRDGRLIARSLEVPQLRAISPNSIAAGEARLEPGWVVMAALSPDGRRFAVVGQSEQVYERVRGLVRDQLILPFLVLAVGLSALLWVGLNFGLRPLNDLARTLTTRDSRDLSPLAESGSTYAELKPLGAALNDKLRRIRSLLEAERTFFADAAHELRTPLAVIGAQAHVVAAEVEPERRNAAITELDRGIARASAVVSRLLTLTRLDSHAAELAREKVRLDDLAAAVVESLREQASRKDQSIYFVAPQRVEVVGSHRELTIAIEALLLNAIQHTPVGTRIDIAVWLQESEAGVSVEDDGPGVPGPERTRIFERFRRLSAASEGGSGLGLAIARRVAELHGGHVALESAAGGHGCRFVLTVPVGH
jgi:signal transduction histidine kinase